MEHLFQPVSHEYTKNCRTLSRYQIGKIIDIFTDKFPNTAVCKVGLIGLDTTFDAVRPHLYEMNHDFKNLPFADFGTVIDNSPQGIEAAIRAVREKGILPLVIGQHYRYAITQCNAHFSDEKRINIALIDERIPFTMAKHKTENDWLNAILGKEKVFNLNIIGCQSHYVDKRVFAFFEKEYFEYLRLGQLKNNLEEAEPLIRDADLLVFNLRALKKIEVPASPDASPSGLFTEEACQMSYYSGISDKMQSFGIFGFQPEKDVATQTVQVVSQMIWYFLFGYYHRKQDYPLTSGQEYVVHFKSTNFELHFWKSTKSDRWFLEIPTKQQKHRPHRLVPCSYEDYLQACQEELSERILNAFHRFGVKNKF